MHLKLRDQKLKNYQVYIERYIKNLVIATNQKSVIDTHTHTQKSKYNTKDSHQISREEDKGRKGKETSIKTNSKWREWRQDGGV